MLSKTSFIVYDTLDGIGSDMRNKTKNRAIISPKT